MGPRFAEGSYDSRPAVHPFRAKVEAQVVTQNVDYIKDIIILIFH